MKKDLTEQHLTEIQIFCCDINVFTVTFDQFNAPLWNESNNTFFFQTFK